jgi:amidase
MGVVFAPVVSAQTFDLTAVTIEDINRAFDAGTLTSEKLIEMYLARIAAYDEAGPTLNAVIAMNPKAMETARSLEAERKARGPRSRLHGIPVVLKDNIDTADIPTTAGSILLEGSLPPDDAFIVRKLRDAGAIILAKVNMSEFAVGGALSSLGGSTRNPHHLARSPLGSSVGTGAAIAAAYAQLGLGTDTGGSVRGPSSANGIVGLKPTHGLLSRDGIIPLALSFDTAGPMARHVYDVAAALGVMTGIDAADDATRKSEGRFETDYTQYLDASALKGARIGIARDFLGHDSEVDWIIEASLEVMRDAGATVVDVHLPQWLLNSSRDLYTAIRPREFRAQISDYLATLAPRFPKTLSELVQQSVRLTAPTDGGQPNPDRWSLMKREEDSGELSDHEYRAVHEHGLPLVRSIIEGLIQSENLDAIVYPTRPRRPPRIDADPNRSSSDWQVSPLRFANLTGFPDLVVPAGFTGNGIPVGISFLGTAFSEPRLLALGYAFEQVTKVRRLPVHTPALPTVQ